MLQCIQVVIIVKYMIPFFVLFFLAMMQMPIIFSSNSAENYNTDDLAIRDDVYGLTKQITDLKKDHSKKNVNTTQSPDNSSSSSDDDSNALDISKFRSSLDELAYILSNLKEVEPETKKTNSNDQWILDKDKKTISTLHGKNEKEDTAENNNIITSETNSNNQITNFSQQKEIFEKQDVNNKNQFEGSQKKLANNNPNAPSIPIDPEDQSLCSSWKKKYFIGLPMILICLYGSYKYVPWKKLIAIRQLNKIIAVEQADAVQKPISSESEIAELFNTKQDAIMITEQNNNNIKIEEVEVTSTQESPVNCQSNQQPSQTLGGQQLPLKSLQLLGSSFSATFLLACASYLLTTDPHQGLKRIERTNYDTCREYLRYAVAIAAASAAVFLFYGISQNT